MSQTNAARLKISSNGLAYTCLQSNKNVQYFVFFSFATIVSKKIITHEQQKQLLEVTML